MIAGRTLIELWFSDVEAAQEVLSWGQVDCWRDVTVRGHSRLMWEVCRRRCRRPPFSTCAKNHHGEKADYVVVVRMAVRPRRSSVLVQRQVVNEWSAVSSGVEWAETGDYCTEFTGRSEAVNGVGPEA